MINTTKTATRARRSPAPATTPAPARRRRSPPAAPAAPAPVEFKVKKGSNREKAFALLHRNLGQMVAVETLVAEVYGPEADVKASRGPLKMVLKGVGIVLKAKSLPFELRTQKGSVGLFARAGR